MRIYGNPESKILFVLSYQSREALPVNHHPLDGSVGNEAIQCFQTAGLDYRDYAFTYAYPFYVDGRNEGDYFYRNKTQCKTTPHHIFEDGSRTIHDLKLYSDALRGSIAASQFSLIVPVGDIALLSTYGNSSANNMRGSMLNACGKRCIPTVDFRRILFQYPIRWAIIEDLKRAVKNARDQSPFVEPEWQFITQPDKATVLSVLESIRDEADSRPVKLAVDLETVNPLISCCGIAWDCVHAICIPFMRETDAASPSYWSTEDELEIILALRTLLTHPNVSCDGQNFLYDCQYFARNWGFVPNVGIDTMLYYHTVFSSDTPKTLDYLASLFCEYYVFWKEESRHRGDNIDDLTHWRYNCKDCVATFEIATEVRATVAAFNLQPQADFQMRMFHRALRPMLKGIVWDFKQQDLFRMELLTTLSQQEQALAEIIPADHYFPGEKGSPYYRSPKKLAHLLYSLLGLPLQRHKKTKQPTTDDDALLALCKGDPIFAPWLKLILKYRSTCLFKQTYVDARIDRDGRMRTSYNPGGTGTFRFSSSQDAFDFGLNLQNLSSGEDRKGLI